MRCKDADVTSRSRSAVMDRPRNHVLASRRCLNAEIARARARARELMRLSVTVDF